MPLKIKKKELKPVNEIVKDFNLLIPLVANLYDWNIEQILGDTEDLNANLYRTNYDDVDTDEEEEFDRETLNLQSKILNDYEDWYDMLINDEGLIWDKERPVESAKSLMDIWNKGGLDSQILKSHLLQLWFDREDDEVGVSKEDKNRFGEIEQLVLPNWDTLDERIDDLDTTEVVELKYKGVDLLLDPETNEVYDPETNDKAGIWDGENVDFFEGFEILEDEEDDNLRNYDPDKIYTNLFINGETITVRQINYEVLETGKKKEIYLDEDTNEVYDENTNLFGVVSQEDVDEDNVADWYENEKEKR
jgi:hypothetical protein